MRKRNLLALLAVPTLGAIALAGYLATRGDTIATDVFPEVLPIQVELHPGEVLRKVETYEDKITPKHAVADDQKGTTSEYWFRPDGTLERALTRSAPDLTGATIEIRRAELLQDGTYKYDVEFALDGAKLKELVLLDPTTQRRQYFYASGDVRRDQYIKRDRQGWRLDIESVYREDRSLAKTFKALDYEGYEQKDFSDAGILVKMTKMASWKSDYTLVEYQSDGKTPVSEFRQTHQQTWLTVYRKDGTKDVARMWSGPLDKAIMTVDVFDATGTTVLYHQYWFPRPDYKWVLWLVEDYFPDKKSHRTIYFDDKTGKVKSETEYFDANHWVLRDYREDGTLSSEQLMESGPGKGEKREYTVEQNVRIKPFPAEWIVDKKFEIPPTVIEYIVPMYH